MPRTDNPRCARTRWSSESHPQQKQSIHPQQNQQLRTGTERNYFPARTLLATTACMRRFGWKLQGEWSKEAPRYSQQQINSSPEHVSKSQAIYLCSTMLETLFCKSSRQLYPKGFKRYLKEQQHRAVPLKCSTTHTHTPGCPLNGMNEFSNVCLLRYYSADARTGSPTCSMCLEYWLVSATNPESPPTTCTCNKNTTLCLAMERVCAVHTHNHEACTFECIYQDMNPTHWIRRHVDCLPWYRPILHKVPLKTVAPCHTHRLRHIAHNPRRCILLMSVATVCTSITQTLTRIDQIATVGYWHLS